MIVGRRLDHIKKNGLEYMNVDREPNVNYDTIDTEKCDNCGDCTDVCPMEVLILEDGKLTITDPEECSYCETCVDLCPNECITIE